MSMNYEHIENERKVELLCDLLNEYETRMEVRERDGEDPDCEDWQDLINGCREFIEIGETK